MHRAAPLLTLLALGLLPLACSDDPVAPGLTPEPIPPPDAPENLIAALEVIYNDTVRSGTERYRAYQDLFPPDDHPTLPRFVFRFQPSDVGRDLPPSWGLDSELLAHRNMFQAQTDRIIFSLTLDIQHLPPAPIDDEDGKKGWMRIVATDVNLRLMFNSEDGIEVGDGLADFDLSPADGRWYINEWKDIEPILLDRTKSVEPATWGAIKALFE